MNATNVTKQMAMRTAVWIAALAAFAAWQTPTVYAQRDRGVNQPGAAGNRDRGINQPGVASTPVGYGGSARQVRAVGDPGLNQPGAAGNAGRDPGLNQPGASRQPLRLAARPLSRRPRCTRKMGERTMTRESKEEPAQESRTRALFCTR